MADSTERKRRQPEGEEAALPLLRPSNMGNMNPSDPGSLEIQESADKTMNGQEYGLRAQSNTSM